MSISNSRFASIAASIRACAPGFYDPMLYHSGCEIAFIGQVEGIAHRKIGQFNYAYPTLAASTVYLWPIRPARPQIREQVYMGAGWGWGPGWWGYPGWWWY